MQKLPFDSEALKDWFRKFRRSLPWRETPTPYAVWISEVMLQQTQVAVVKDYFLRWMQKFPTVESLAEAPLELVIKMWEGLGYYTRARNLHAAAQFLVENYGGKLPDTRGALEEVPGLGPYTIGAILSFAFRQKAAAVDGNTVRVLSRYFAIEEDVQKGQTQKKLRQVAEEILPDQEPWLVVEGLIELGATVCKREPNCMFCPLREGCQAYQRGIQQELPKKGKKVEITTLLRNVFVVIHQRELLVKKGQEGKVMADLYEFPYMERKQNRFPFSFAAKRIRKLSAVEHSFTRYQVTLYPTLWIASERHELTDHEWIAWDKIQEYPFSSGHRRILKELEGYADFTH